MSFEQIGMPDAIKRLYHPAARPALLVTGLETGSGKTTSLAEHD